MFWLGKVWFSPHDIMAYSQLELRSEGKVKLLVTRTGYRSESLPAGTVEKHGGPEAYVKLWLDGSAKSLAWKKRQVTGQQLSLF